MNRETDQFGWQTEFDIGIAEKMKRVAHVLGRLVAFRPQNAPAHMSEHYRPLNEPSDGEAIQPQLPFESVDE